MRFFLMLLPLALTSSARAQAAPRIPTAVRVDSLSAEAFKTDYVKAVYCTQIARPFHDIVWYIVPGGSFRDPVQEARGEQRIRYWGETILTDGEVADTIYLAEVRPEWVVRHEVIHYLRDRIDHDDELNHRCRAPYDPRFEPSTIIARD